MAKSKVVDKDRGWIAMMKRAKAIREAKIKVGVLSDSPAGSAKTSEEEGALTLAELAVVLHYGTKNGHIPPRPALEIAFERHREELVAMGKKLMPQVLLGKMELDKALNMMGAFFANKVKRTITDGEGVPPPNKPSTIRQKKSDRPLVDTGRYVNAFTWAKDK